MKRFMGMMPSSEIEKSATFKDSYGLKVHIDAGPHGWTVRWADGGSSYKDIDATTEENFRAAKDLVESKIGTLTEINKEPMGEM